MHEKNIMGQKIHPLGFRLGITQTHRSQWFEKPKNYSTSLQEDFLIREYLTSETRKGADPGLAKVLLARRGEKIFVELYVAQPKLVTGEDGSRLKEFTKGIQSALLRMQSGQSVGFERKNLQTSGTELSSAELNQNTAQALRPISLQVFQIMQPATDATLVAQKVAQQLEKRVAFRRIMKQTIQQAREAGVEGIKVQIAGRLNGAEIARTEWAREGRVPLHTLRANIDYCAYPAQTIYGLLGIKIWIYKAMPQQS
jgi:small subunit ribosomal protein S3